MNNQRIRFALGSMVIIATALVAGCGPTPVAQTTTTRETTTYVPPPAVSTTTTTEQHIVQPQ